MNANKLIDLDITKVAFVDEGDNPEADILLFKRKEPEPPAGGEEFSEEENGFIGKLAKALARLFKSEDAPDEEAGLEKKSSETASKEIDDEPEEGNAGDTEIPDDNEEETAEKGGKVGKSKDNEEGEYTDMARIDKSKLTAEELAQLEAIEKKALVDDEPESEGIEKGKDAGGTEEGSEDIYKGIHPLVKAKLEALEKFKAQAEAKELLDIAKRYEILGEKPEELAVALGNVKKAGGTAYNDMIAVLDASKKAVESSSAFSEIGKKGGSIGGTDDVMAKAAAKAEEIRKASPELTHDQAMAKAWEQNPDLFDEYDNEIGGVQ